MVKRFDIIIRHHVAGVRWPTVRENVSYSASTQICHLFFINSAWVGGTQSVSMKLNTQGRLDWFGSFLLVTLTIFDKI